MFLLNFFDNLFRIAVEFIEMLFGRKEKPWIDKEYMSSGIFEKYIDQTIEKKNVSKIYFLGSFRADGKYLLRMKKVLDSGEYYKICFMHHEYAYYVEDDLGYIPYGDRVEIFLIQYDNDRFRIIAELREVPEWQKLYTTPFKYSILFGCDNIPQSALFFIFCKEQIYPVD